MENQNNIKRPLLEESVDDPTSLEHQKDVSVTKKRLGRSRSAPLLVSLPEDYLTVTENEMPNDFLKSGLVKKRHHRCKKIMTFLSIYLLVGALCFYLIRDQLSGKRANDGIIDALYFCIVTMTMVGYGDVVPQSTLARLLVCAYAFSGMALAGLFLSQAANYLVEKQEILLVYALQLRRRFIHPSEIMKGIIQTQKARHKCILAFLVLFVLVICGTIFLILVEKFDVVDAFYCVCVTIMSLGYRDYGFSTKIGHVLAVLWVLASFICLWIFFISIAELSTERRQIDIVKWVLSRRVTIVDLEANHINNNGSFIEAAEVVLHKLKEMRKITQTDILLAMKDIY